MQRRAVVTGLGLITPCGIGVEPFRQAIDQGRSGIGPIKCFDASNLQTRFAGEVRDFDPIGALGRKEARRMDRFQQFAMVGAELAMEDAGLSGPPADPSRGAVIIGSSVAGLAAAQEEHTRALARGPGAIHPFFILQVLSNMAPSYVSIRWGFRGLNLAPNSACATGAHAIGEAARRIRSGEIDVALAGGAEAPLCMMAIGGFNQLRALSTRNDDPEGACRPFDAARDGFVMSEGAAIVVVEELDHARNRGARIYGEVAGYGTSADAYHVTAPAPEHRGGRECMEAALRDAGLSPSEIDYVNAHAAGTPTGDPLEVEAFRAVFGHRAASIPMSSTKSMTGHMLAAAGAAEAAVCLLAMQSGRIPPTINLTDPDPKSGVDHVPLVSRPAQIRTAVSNSFGFGGTNATLVLRAL
ncbi:MAG: beta-ketoacyl-ACP synthase II [Gemmatimonadota bacterium]